MRDVVVTGLGAVTSVGTGAEEFAEALLAGASGVRQSSEEGAPATAPCADFDPEAWMTPKEARRTDRFAQLALAAALQAAKEAGLPDGVEPERLGILMGTGVGGLVTLQRECEAWIANGDRAVSPLFVPMMMPNAAAGAVAMALGAHGPGWSVASACARCPGAACRRRSTWNATGSSWARAQARSCSRPRSTRRRAARASAGASPASARRTTPST